MPNQIFVSFSTKDLDKANTILNGLKARGVARAFMSADPEQGIRAGEEWRRRLESELRYARVFMPLISENWLGSSWCHAELRIAKFMGMSIFPVHIGKADTRGITGEVDELQGLSAYLVDGDSIDKLATSLNERLKLRRGQWDGQLNRLYPAAAAYQPDQAAVFFGRDAEIAAIRREVSAIIERENPSERVLIYSGASGVGKSSLVRAGLLPELTVDPSVLVLGPLRPLDGLAEPGESLTDALLRIAARPGVSDAELANALAEIGSWIAAGPSGLVAGLKGIARLRTARDFVIIIDQAEEWLLDDAHVIAQRAAILGLLGASWRRMACVLVARDDAIARLDALLPRVQPGRATQTLLLRPMARDQLREVIRGPLEIASLIPLASDPLTEAFVDAVLEDAEGATDALPLVSQLMARLVGEGTGGTTVERYREIGGLAGAIAMAAEQCLGENPSDDLLVAVRSAFMAMAQVEPSGQVRIGRAELGEIAPEARPVLDRMAAAGLRLLRKTSGTIEPTHESLLRRWPRLEAWLRDEAVRLGALAQALRDAADWERSGRRPDLLLHRGERLEAVRPLLDDPIYVSKFYDALDYLSACHVLQDAQEKERRAREVQVSSGLSRLLANKAREAHNAGLHTKAMRYALAGWLEGTLNGGDTAHAEAALAASFHESRALIVLPHNGQVTSAAFSPDGSLVVTVTCDNTCAVWDAESGNQIFFKTNIKSAYFSKNAWKLIYNSIQNELGVWDILNDNRVLKFTHFGNAESFSFSSDGQRVATVRADGDLIDIRSIRRRFGTRPSMEVYDRPLVCDGKVLCLAFSPDGALVAAASDKGTVTIWASDTGARIAWFRGDKSVHSIAFSPESERILASSGWSSSVRDARTGAEIVGLTQNNHILSASFSPDGARIITASADGTSVVWNAGTGAAITRFTHESAVGRVSFSPDAMRVLIAPEKVTSALHDLEKDAELARFTHEEIVESAVFSPNGARVVTASFDEKSIIWDARARAETAFLMHNDSVYYAEFSPDGKRIVTASHDKTSIVWNAETGMEVARFNHDHAVGRACFSSDGARVVTASADLTSVVWDAESGIEIARFTHHHEVIAAAFSPDGTRVVTVSHDTNSVVWDACTGAEIARFVHGGSAMSAVFSPDGNRVVTASDDKSSVVWDAWTGIEIARFVHGGKIYSASFSPDGNRVVTASDDKSSVVWDAWTGIEIARFIHGGSAMSAAFSPDGNRVVTASHDKSSVVWDAASGLEIGRFLGSWFLSHAAFSQNGERIITTDENRGVIWDARTGLEIASFRHPEIVINSVASSDGSRLATVGGKFCLIWDTRFAIELVGSDLVRAVCNQKLIGAERFTDKEMRDCPVKGIPRDIVAASLKGLAAAGP